MADYIYTLSEKNGSPFYVGRTNNMKRRLGEHRSSSKTGTEVKYQFIRDLESNNKEWTMDILIEIDESSKNYEDFYVYLLISEGYKLTNMKAGDAMKAGEQEAMEAMNNRGDKFSTPEEFLTAREMEIKEFEARKKADRLNVKYSSKNKSISEVFDYYYDETKVLIAGNKPHEQFISPAFKAMKEKRRK